MKSTLVVFNSKTEYDAVRRIKVPGKRYWIGLVHDPGESLLQWDDGSYPNYLNNRGGRFSKQEFETRFYMDRNNYGWKYSELYFPDTGGKVSVQIAKYTENTNFLSSPFEIESCRATLHLTRVKCARMRFSLACKTFSL